MLHTKFGQDWSSSSCEEDAYGRRTMDDHGRHPIARGHQRKATQIPGMQIAAHSATLPIHHRVNHGPKLPLYSWFLMDFIYI